MVAFADLGKLYVDANILVSLYLKSEIHPETKVNQSKVTRQIFKEFKKNKNVKLYISNWVLLETFKILVKRKGQNPEKVYCWIDDIRLTEKIRGVNLVILKFKPTYSVEELFKDVKHNLIDFSQISFADNIHIIIMKKSKIKEILTFDVRDFSQIPIVVQIDPTKLYDGLVK